jgi:hypothetical protein
VPSVDLRESSSGFVPALRTGKFCSRSSPANTSPKSRFVEAITTSGPSGRPDARALEAKANCMSEDSMRLSINSARNGETARRRNVLNAFS